MPQLILAPIPLNNLMDKLTNDELELVKSICRNGYLRTKPPALTYDEVGRHIKYKKAEENSACSYYLWKRLAYWLSPYKKDHATPPNPHVYLPADLAGRAKKLDRISDIIINSVPQEYQYGPISRGEK